MRRSRVVFLVVVTALAIHAVVIAFHWQGLVYRETGRVERLRGDLFLVTDGERRQIREPLIWHYPDVAVVVLLRHRLSGDLAIRLEGGARAGELVTDPQIPEAFEVVAIDTERSRSGR